MDIKISEVLGTRLQGEPKGTKDFGRMCGILRNAKPGELATLNFEGVEIATASWLSAMLIPLWRWAADEYIDLYFVLRNGIGAEWLYDLKLMARYNRQGFLICGPEASPTGAVLVGPLDASHRKTLEMIQAGEATGADLERRCPDEGVGATAWNNRLRDLHKQRLIRCVRRGRARLYSPIVGKLTYDG